MQKITKQAIQQINQVCEVKNVYKTKQKVAERPKINKSNDAQFYIRPYFEDIMDSHEITGALLLDAKNGIISFIKLGEGSATGCVLNEQMLYRAALLSNAQGVILCHNHPSGNLKFSDNDIKLTKAVKIGLELLKINMLDHILITQESYLSYADNF